MISNYQLGFQQPVAPQRLQDFIDGKLDLNETVLLMQDVLETGLIHRLSSPFFFAAQYCVDQGYVTVYGRLLH
jgi:hypothetical protein